MAAVRGAELIDVRGFARQIVGGQDFAKEDGVEAAGVVHEVFAEFGAE